MHIPKKYFHDRIIIVLLSANTFLALLCSLLVALGLNNAGSDVYIVQYRQNLGLSAFKRGDSLPLVSFALFAVITLVVNVLLSLRTYPIRRQFAVAILAMGLLLLILATIVSSALLDLR